MERVQSSTLVGELVSATVPMVESAPLLLAAVVLHALTLRDVPMVASCYFCASVPVCTPMGEYETKT